MAYNADGNTIVCIGNGGSLGQGEGSSRRVFHYVSNDTLAVIDDDDYFLDEYTRLVVGDIILVSADLDGTPAHNTLMVVASAAGGVDTVVSA